MATTMARGRAGALGVEPATRLAAFEQVEGFVISLLREAFSQMQTWMFGPAQTLRAFEVSRSFRRWTWEQQPRTRKSTVERWNVQNEYHVQNLLWAILAPLFHDLNDEETLSPVGQMNPRVDLSIPSLKTIVEVKFLRPGTPMQSMIGEIAEDAGLYRTDSRWTSLIPFIWDDSSRTEEHAKLVEGLNKLDMVIGSVVVPRPGMMAATTTSEVSVKL
jgi:hypothetical protein